MTRFKPDLPRFDDGTSPPTDQLHVHHATWLNVGATYGSGPFAASGEEKTYLRKQPSHPCRDRHRDIGGRRWDGSGDGVEDLVGGFGRGHRRGIDDEVGIRGHPSTS